MKGAVIAVMVMLMGVSAMAKPKKLVPVSVDKTGKAVPANLDEKMIQISMIQVEGWHSEADAIKTQDALKKLDGVMSVKCKDYKSGHLMVHLDPMKVKKEAVEKTIVTCGYKVKPMAQAPVKNKNIKKMKAM